MLWQGACGKCFGRTIAAGCVSPWGQRLLVLSGVHRLPLSLDNARANLRSAFPLLGLLVSVKVFSDAGAAFGAMFAGEAIQQAAVPLAAVAMAIAGLLVQRLLDLCGDRVRILYHGIREEFRVHRRGKRALRGSRMVGGHSFIGCGLRRICALERIRSGPSLVTSMTSSPFNLSIWLLAMK